MYQIVFKMKSKATASMHLDKRRTIEDGTYPIKLRITYNRKREYYRTPYYATEKEYEKIYGSKPRDNYKTTRIKLDAIVEEAENVIDNLDEFSFPGFKEVMYKQKIEIDVFKFCENHIKALKANDQYGTASTYTTSLKSLKGFVNNKKIRFEDITVKFLKSYERKMLKDKSKTTISINVRCFRKLFNLAIQKGIVKQSFYPFGSEDADKYKPVEHNRSKTFLNSEELKKIIQYKPIQGTTEDFCRDIWLFSYLCYGMNMTDILRLKYQDIYEDHIEFIRTKTKTRRRLKTITVYLLPESQQIIEKWGTKPRKDEHFVFTLLKGSMPEEVKIAKIKQQTKQVNKYIKRIGESLKISKKITFQVARHSFATKLLYSDQSIPFISEAMGHHNTETTQNYLGSFDLARHKIAAQTLLDF